MSASSRGSFLGCGLARLALALALALAPSVQAELAVCSTTVDRVRLQARLLGACASKPSWKYAPPSMRGGSSAGGSPCECDALVSATADRRAHGGVSSCSARSLSICSRVGFSPGGRGCSVRGGGNQSGAARHSGDRPLRPGPSPLPRLLRLRPRLLAAPRLLRLRLSPRLLRLRLRLASVTTDVRRNAGPYSWTIDARQGPSPRAMVAGLVTTSYGGARLSLNSRRRVRARLVHQDALRALRGGCNVQAVGG